LTGILLASTTMAIVFVGIPNNMNIATAEDDSERTIIESSGQSFNVTGQNLGCGDKGLDADAVWCV
jgi:hypothetical protein